MILLADISHGNVTLADWLFLIAAILALLAAIAVAPVTKLPKLAAWGATFVALAICLLAVAWLVL